MGRISDTVGFPPKQFNMPQISSTDATFHAAQDFIYALHNPAPASPLLKLGNGQTEALRDLAEIFIKSKTPEVPLRVPIRAAFQQKLQQVNQEISKIKFHSNQIHSPMQNL